jgi:hypothetical protein
MNDKELKNTILTIANILCCTIQKKGIFAKIIKTFSSLNERKNNYLRYCQKT